MAIQQPRGTNAPRRPIAPKKQQKRSTTAELGKRATKAEKTLISLEIDPMKAGATGTAEEGLAVDKAIQLARKTPYVQPQKAAERVGAYLDEQPKGLGPDFSTEEQVSDFQTIERANEGIRQLMGGTESTKPTAEERQTFGLSVSPLTRPGDHIQLRSTVGLGGYSGREPSIESRKGFAGGVWTGAAPKTTGRGTPIGETTQTVKGNFGRSRTVHFYGSLATDPVGSRIDPMESLRGQAPALTSQNPDMRNAMYALAAMRGNQSPSFSDASAPSKTSVSEPVVIKPPEPQKAKFSGGKGKSTKKNKKK